MRLPVTFWTYCLWELLRLTVLATAVIVTAIAFAVTVQFYARGQLGPLDTLRFMAFAMIPMLQYALPFAAGLAATLAYYRLVQDNELIAARAGGMSHLSILGPALVAGVVLALALGALTDRVIPRFLRGMEEMVSEKIATVIANTINNNQSFQYDRFMLHADQVVQVEPEAGSGVESELVLLGAVFVELDPEGNVERQGSARRVRLWVRPGEASGAGSRTSYAMIQAEDLVGDFDVAPGARAGLVRKVWQLPGGIDDDPKFLTGDELRRAQSRPEMLNIIDPRRRDLAYHIGKHRILEQVVSTLQIGAPVEFTLPSADRLVVRAGGARVEGDRIRLQPLRGRDHISVELIGPEQVQSYEAGRAEFRVDLAGDPSTRSLDQKLTIWDATQPRTPGEALPPIPEKVFSGLQLEPDPLPGLLQQSTTDLLEEGKRLTTGPGAVEWIRPPVRELDQRIAKLQREILSKRHERWAVSCACFVMIATGAIMAMRLAGASPLAVYLWSFFPALLALLTISSGQQMTYQSGPVGLLLLWGGVAGLAAYASVVFFSLTRH
ncbi:MAG: LptF/LptG family permease [Phycisphaerales bacterium JB039]